MAAIYQADVWCDGCAEEIRNDHYAGRIDQERGLSREEWEVVRGFDDETNYDSDEYPKHCSDDEESDCPQHCAAGAECVCAEKMSDGTKVGYFFGNNLTTNGADYVAEAVRDDLAAGRNDSPAVEIWMLHYDHIDYGPEDRCIACGDWTVLDCNDECEECADVEEE